MDKLIHKYDSNEIVIPNNTYTDKNIKLNNKKNLTVIFYFWNTYL